MFGPSTRSHQSTMCRNLEQSHSYQSAMHPVQLSSRMLRLSLQPFLAESAQAPGSARRNRYRSFSLFHRDGSSRSHRERLKVCGLGLFKLIFDTRVSLPFPRCTHRTILFGLLSERFVGFPLGRQKTNSGLADERTIKEDTRLLKTTALSAATGAPKDFLTFRSVSRDIGGIGHGGLSSKLGVKGK